MDSKPKNLKSFIQDENPFLDALLPGCGFGFISTDFSRIPLFDDLQLLDEKSFTGKNSTTHLIRYRCSCKLIEFEMVYEYFPSTNVLEISGKVRNSGAQTLHSVKGPFSLSLELDLSGTGPIRMSNLHGGSETAICYPPPAYHIMKTDGVHHVSGGIHGGRSSETDAPYAIFTDLDETCGFFFAYEWPCRWIFSCSQFMRNGSSILSLLAHVAEVEMDFSPGEEMIFPKTVLGFFRGNESDGLNQLRKHIIRNVRRIHTEEDKLLPVFYNHWFGYDSRFNEELLKQEARVYAELGCEYFVVDAGWHKGGFRAGIGNWEIEDSTKFPHGMLAFSEYVRSLGMKFGMWLEPEFAMSGTDWVKRHPDWFYTAPGRRDFVNHKRIYGERLLKLDDLTVRRAVLNFLVKFVEKYHLEWLRWDCNNSPAQFWDANEKENEWGKIQNAYGNGLFSLLDEFMAACPHVHIETCAGGGHRMDLGTLRRAHSCWMSDNAAGYDAIRRYQINMNRFLGPCYSNSVFLWGKERLEKGTRYDSFPSAALRSKMAGPLGFSEPTHFYTEESKAVLKKEIALYKKYRPLLLKDFYPLFEPRSLSDFDGWQVHDPESGEGMFMVFRCHSPLSETIVNLNGLNPGERYVADDLDTGEKYEIVAGCPCRIFLPEMEAVAWIHYQRILSGQNS